MLTVALTGNVASGKSTVARIWREAGVPVVSADELAREVVEPGRPALEEIREAFGPGVFAADGTLDRAELRDRVFRDEAARRELEGILHPRIEAGRRRWMEARRREGCPLAVAEIPLLFEVGAEGAFDVTVLVDAPPGTRLARIVEDRGLDEAEARRIMDAQMDAGEKRERADHVLENAGSPEELRGRALRLLERLRHRAAGATG